METSNKSSIGIEANKFYCKYCRGVISSKRNQEMDYHSNCRKSNSSYRNDEDIGNIEILESALGFKLDRLTKFEEETNGVTLENNKIAGLSLRDAGITKIPDFLTKIKNLRSINLTMNELSTLPDSFKRLKSLEYLNLELNQFKEFPRIILDLPNLKHLNISENEISLPSKIGSITSLKYLDASNTALSTLPKSIGDLINLQILNLQNNKLQSLPNSIGRLPNLKELVLSGNRLVNIPITIKQLKNLISLDLEVNRFEIEHYRIHPYGRKEIKQFFSNFYEEFDISRLFKS